MARPESQALAGYFKTPTHLLPVVASHLALGAGVSFSVVDPCAADGEAVFGIAEELFKLPARTVPLLTDAEYSAAMDVYRAAPYGEGEYPDRDPDVALKHARERIQDAKFLTCELEKTRFESLKSRSHSPFACGCNSALHGDALCVTWEQTEGYGKTPPGAGLLFLNPPYDFERECKRLEEKFLRRYTSALCMGGVLVFLVPFYSLAASADTLAQHFTDLRCYKFPDPDYSVFKQVVLFGTRRPALFGPDPAVRAQVIAWSESTEDMPVLGNGDSPTIVPGFEERTSAFSLWKSNPLDVAGLLLNVRPWFSSDKGGKFQPIVGVVPGDGDLLRRAYPLATPPKPAHIAAGIASGVFNGARVEPDSADSPLPPLYVKGVFDKDFVTVDTKLNKDGEKTGEIQVQQPKLRVTVLDTRTAKFHTLRSSAKVSDARNVAEMSTGDLLSHYGKGLMRVMLEQCPVMHDPARADEQIELAPLARPLYRAQAQAVQAIVKLLGGVKASRAQRRGKAAILLGEIGCGKSSCALATAQTIGARRVLILCPPHLLDGWSDQAKAVTPWARVFVLRDVADVDAFCGDTDPSMSIAVLSRETAKLGHSWAGVAGLGCPKCGRELPGDNAQSRVAPEDLARKRTTCDARSHTPRNTIARVVRDLAIAMLAVSPAAPEVGQVLRGRHFNRMRIAAHGRTEERRLGTWLTVRRSAVVRSCVTRIVRKMVKSDAYSYVTAVADPLLGLLCSLQDAEVTEQCVRFILTAALPHKEDYGVGAALRVAARNLWLLLPADEARDTGFAAMLLKPTSDWYDFQSRRDAYLTSVTDPQSHVTHLSSVAGVSQWNKHALGTPACLIGALAQLTSLGQWKTGELCGEPLYQAVPEPRRYPLATYLAKNYSSVVDLLVLDEQHEYSSSDSAQSFAAYRLAGLGMPVLGLTGSIMNGYAGSMFAGQWALNPEFRKEFRRDEVQAFIRRYGYLKQLVEEKNKDGKAQVFGSQSDRVEQTAKTIGTAPGVLPVFVLRLLRMAVTLQKKDLALDLPECKEIVEYIAPSEEIKSRYERMATALKNKIKQDRFSPDLAGKLFGQMSEIPSYLDRATVDTGNVASGAYEVAYPESCGSGVVASYPGLPAETILPKEQWMLDRVRSEIQEGRRVMVFGWHEAVLPRLVRLIEEQTGEKVALLLSAKVASGKRQAWIDREVIGKNRNVLVVNPVCVQTGLNNLVWFCSEIWMQNPGCNPIVYRQAVGRVDRIGQKKESRIYIPVYGDTAQALAHKLLLHKVGVSLATDGLDAESALAAAGVGDAESFDGFSVGRMLFEMMDRGDSMDGDRPRTVAVSAPVPMVAPAPVVANQNAVAVVPRVKKVQLDLFGGMS